MRKKKVEQLKESIKKELIKELDYQQKEEEKNKKMPQKPIKPPVLYHSKEELESIQKSFLKIFLFAVTFLMGAIILLIINPFHKPEKKLEIDSGDPIKEEKRELKLSEREDGPIENTNEEALNLFLRMSLNTDEYYNYDSTYLYSKEELLVKDIPRQYLLFLMSKTSDFKDIIKKGGLLTKTELCSKNGTIRIPIEDIQIIMENNFNITLDQYDDFIYSHYINNTFSTFIKFTYSDGYYVSFCEERSNVFNYASIATSVIKEVVKEKDMIHVKAGVAFITKDKVYADYKLQRIISNNVNDDILTYIQEADVYDYVFKGNDSGYYLDKIIKVTK